MARILVSGITEIDPSKFNSPINREVNDEYDMSYLNKPNGCLWGSTKVYDKWYMSDWLRFVSDEDFYVEKYQKAIGFTLKKKTRICTINTVEDYRNIMKRYSKKKFKDKPLDRFNSLVIDWEALALDYDAFHLTKIAFLRMRLPLNSNLLRDDNGNRLENFYSYDCETWILFNLDCINKGSILNYSTGVKAL